MRWSRVFPLAAALLAAAALPGAILPAWGQTSPQDLYVDESQDQGNQVFQSLRDFGSYGSSMGVMKVMGGDLGKDAEIKPVLQGIFRYRFSDTWVGVGEFGFGWNSFKDRGDTVATFSFGTLGFARRVGTKFSTDFRLTGGAGVYRWNYKFHGKSLRDPSTQRFYRGISPGGYVGTEAEYRLSRHVTLIGHLQQHYVMSADEDLFHSVFDQNYPFMSFRISANYHFSPYEGILWERKRGQRIRLESGREGK